MPDYCDKIFWWYAAWNSGLIRAYQAASKEGLEHSTVLSVSDGVLAQIDADYNSIGKIQYICLETDIDILKTEYTENVYMEMIVQAENYGQFVQKITDAFSGKNFCCKNSTTEIWQK